MDKFEASPDIILRYAEEKAGSMAGFHVPAFFGAE